MTDIPNTFNLDGEPIRFEPGETILQAALKAGHFIPHLCFSPEFKPHGSCKLCIVVVNNRTGSSCAMKALPGLEVQSDTPDLNHRRRTLLQMLFVEGNHFCPGCEKSGNCKLQALAYDLEMFNDHFTHFFQPREVDASHPDFFLDRNRCINCELCVRASRDVDGKDVFGLAGRGRNSHLVVNSPSGKLGDSTFAKGDKAAEVCPVGALLPKGQGFKKPIGARLYDNAPISQSFGVKEEV
ncbi:[NiFe] hydrogenase diaphorase moiety small subunit [Rhodoblastus acidophilus]|uniref:2Fe-2S iron-sulfur cluster-binding protein n=1 Tax=Rhodoblastus acidophilus TaxID=1074 RepID=UPI00179F0647|nr:2Fe-2S iron-sulfur cluster-binding protein [Rhodoblastus acidophilus]MCW2286023.1 [NiFe] hydrogenase diaphorase moiety small subunit [Rhodoblastus acidophilus]MCW2334917.1 [NiFe] hydrogenase diaphorase moiety small subunit [Rhodoblastus acidophilus]